MWTVCGWTDVWPAGGEQVNSGAGRPVSDDGEQHPQVCGRVNAGKECGYLACCPIGVCEAGSRGQTLAEVGLEWRLLPSYAPAALWRNGPSRACGGSWGPCSAWSSRGSGRHRASVTSEGQRWGEGAAVWQPSVVLCDPQQEGGQLQAHTCPQPGGVSLSQPRPHASECRRGWISLLPSCWDLREVNSHR